MKVDINELVAAAVAEAVAGNGGWLRAHCPVCVIQQGKEDRRFSLGFNPETIYFHCFRCEVKGFLNGDYHELIDDTREEKKENEPPPEAASMPEGFMPLYTEEGLSSYAARHARNYLLKRNVPQETWAAAKLGVTFRGRHRNRIIIPIYADGVWKGWIGRTWINGGQNYKYPMGMKRGEVMFNQDALLVETDEPAIIVEGGFDALPHAPNAVACLGKPARGQFELLVAAKRPLVVALDGDAWIEGKALMMKLIVKKKTAAFIKFPPRKDPGDISHTKLLTIARRRIAPMIAAAASA